MKKSTIAIMILIIMSIFILGCTETTTSTQGEAGLQGTIGPQGETGLTGPQGEDGTNGISGYEMISKSFDAAPSCIESGIYHTCHTKVDSIKCPQGKKLISGSCSLQLIGSADSEEIQNEFYKGIYIFPQFKEDEYICWVSNLKVPSSTVKLNMYAICANAE